MAKPDSAWGPGRFYVVTLFRRVPLVRFRNRKPRLRLLVCDAQLLLRSRDGAPIFPNRLQLLLVDEPVGVHCNAWSRFVDHSIDLGKGVSVAHKPGCVVLSSGIMLSDEDV